MAIHYIDQTKQYKDRFDLAKFLSFSNGSFDILTSYFFHKLKDLPSKGNITVTFEVGKPELISDAIYGTTQLDWVIMKYNKLTDINEIVSGLDLNYPSKSDLEKLYFELSSKQKEMIKQKSKNTNTVINLNSEFSEV